MVDHTPSHLRSGTLSELNSWLPPEPTEWLPAGSAEPSNVDGPENGVEFYATLAEHLVALVHSDVPSVFKALPESLTDLDFYFWKEDFPSTRPREALDNIATYALGAYLGGVLVQHLGGR